MFLCLALNLNIYQVYFANSKIIFKYDVIKKLIKVIINKENFPLKLKNISIYL